MPQQQHYQQQFSSIEEIELVLRVKKQSDTGLFKNERLLAIKSGYISYYSHIPKQFVGNTRSLQLLGEMPKYTFSAEYVTKIQYAKPILEIQFFKDKLIDKDSFKKIIDQAIFQESMVEGDSKENNRTIKENTQKKKQKQNRMYWRFKSKQIDLTNAFVQQVKACMRPQPSGQSQQAEQRANIDNKFSSEHEMQKNTTIKQTTQNINVTHHRQTLPANRHRISLQPSLKIASKGFKVAQQERQSRQVNELINERASHYFTSEQIENELKKKRATQLSFGNNMSKFQKYNSNQGLNSYGKVDLHNLTFSKRGQQIIVEREVRPIQVPTAYQNKVEVEGKDENKEKQEKEVERRQKRQIIQQTTKSEGLLQKSQEQGKSQNQELHHGEIEKDNEEKQEQEQKNEEEFKDMQGNVKQEETQKQYECQEDTIDRNRDQNQSQLKIQQNHQNQQARDQQVSEQQRNDNMPSQKNNRYHHQLQQQSSRQSQEISQRQNTNFMEVDNSSILVGGPLEQKEQNIRKEQIDGETVLLLQSGGENAEEKSQAEQRYDHQVQFYNKEEDANNLNEDISIMDDKKDIEENQVYQGIKDNQPNEDDKVVQQNQFQSIYTQNFPQKQQTSHQQPLYKSRQSSRCQERKYQIKEICRKFIDNAELLEQQQAQRKNRKRTSMNQQNHENSGDINHQSKDNNKQKKYHQNCFEAVKQFTIRNGINNNKKQTRTVTFTMLTDFINYDCFLQQYWHQNRRYGQFRNGLLNNDNLLNHKKDEFGDMRNYQDGDLESGQFVFFNHYQSKLYNQFNRYNVLVKWIYSHHEKQIRGVQEDIQQHQSQPKHNSKSQSYQYFKKQWIIMYLRYKQYEGIVVDTEFLDLLQQLQKDYDKQSKNRNESQGEKKTSKQQKSFSTNMRQQHESKHPTMITPSISMLVNQLTANNIVSCYPSLQMARRVCVEQVIKNLYQTKSSKDPDTKQQDKYDYNRKIERILDEVYCDKYIELLVNKLKQQQQAIGVLELFRQFIKAIVYELLGLQGDQQYSQSPQPTHSIRHKLTVSNFSMNFNNKKNSNNSSTFQYTNKRYQFIKITDDQKDENSNHEQGGCASVYRLQQTNSRHKQNIIAQINKMDKRQLFIRKIKQSQQGSQKNFLPQFMIAGLINFQDVVRQVFYSEYIKDQGQLIQSKAQDNNPQQRCDWKQICGLFESIQTILSQLDNIQTVYQRCLQTVDDDLEAKEWHNQQSVTSGVCGVVIDDMSSIGYRVRRMNVKFCKLSLQLRLLIKIQTGSFNKWLLLHTDPNNAQTIMDEYNSHNQQTQLEDRVLSETTKLNQNETVIGCCLQLKQINKRKGQVAKKILLQIRDNIKQINALFKGDEMNIGHNNKGNPVLAINNRHENHRKILELRKQAQSAYWLESVTIDVIQRYYQRQQMIQEFYQELGINQQNNNHQQILTAELTNEGLVFVQILQNFIIQCKRSILMFNVKKQPSDQSIQKHKLKRKQANNFDQGKGNQKDQGSKKKFNSSNNLQKVLDQVKYYKKQQPQAKIFTHPQKYKLQIINSQKNSGHITQMISTGFKTKYNNKTPLQHCLYLLIQTTNYQDQKYFFKAFDILINQWRQHKFSDNLMIEVFLSLRKTVFSNNKKLKNRIRVFLDTEITTQDKLKYLKTYTQLQYFYLQ